MLTPRSLRADGESREGDQPRNGPSNAPPTTLGARSEAGLVQLRCNFLGRLVVVPHRNRHRRVTSSDRRRGVARLAHEIPRQLTQTSGSELTYVEFIAASVARCFVQPTSSSATSCRAFWEQRRWRRCHTLEGSARDIGGGDDFEQGAKRRLEGVIRRRPVPDHDAQRRRCAGCELERGQAVQR